MNTKIWIRDYDGFESLYGFDEEIIWALGNEDIVPCGEWQGTLRITLEYIPDTEEQL